MSEGGGALEGCDVALVGRFASMSREEAIDHVVAAGGRHVSGPGPDTALVVYGQGGPPVGDDGRIPLDLRKARRLQDEGAKLEVLSEEELLSRLGLHGLQEDLHRLHTTEQLARILGVSPRLVKRWVRQGLVRPERRVHRLCFFDFQEVVHARALSELFRAGVTPARLRRSLQQLSAWVPETRRSLAQLESIEGAVGVRLDDGSLATANGQLLFGFDEAAGSDAEPDAPAPRLTGPVGDAPGWFDRGVGAEEEGYLEDAVRAYRKSIELDADRPEAHFNLGNVLFALGRKSEAIQAYSTATSLDADYVEAWNNLGNVWSDLGNATEAARAYRRALALAPDYADAHYNFAEFLAVTGDLHAARMHWRAFLALDPSSSWAIEVRSRLEESNLGSEPR